MDCHVTLEPGSNPEAAREVVNRQDLKLAAIRTFMGFTAAFNAEAARNLLEAAGIPCVLTGANFARLTGHGLEVSLMVQEEDAERAVQILDSCSDAAAPNDEGP
jgi:Putative prokaryotic signal transducing protein